MSIPAFWQGFAIGAMLFGWIGMAALAWSLKWHRDTAIMANETADMLNKTLKVILDTKE